VVSDSALDSRIKSARRAVGDDGRAQRVIRTIHVQGFRFVAPVEEAAAVEVAAPLGVRYAVAGTVEADDATLAVTVQLVDTRDAGVVWGDRLASRLADLHETRAAILGRLVAALDLQIPLHEARRARLIAPESLDAWSAYHLGLQHMFRFTRADNAVAGELFAQAVAREPGFARAHAGLSFVQFQNAFLRYTADQPAAVRAARHAAERAVALDPLDPFATLTMGRSFWLDGDLDASLGWLERATAISPSYAQAHYARAWTHALSGRGEAGRADADLAMALSPLDPLHYAMTATRALSHLACGETADAAAWAERAARAPGAHVFIAVIAAACHACDGQRERAAAWAATAHRRAPGLTTDDFFRSFPFADAPLRRRLARALSAAGF
jgi:tetratricopeptide (TPR) repeat protein